MGGNFKRVKVLAGYSVQARYQADVTDAPIGEIAGESFHPHIVYERMGVPIVFVQSKTDHLRVEVFEVLDSSQIEPQGSHEARWYAAQAVSA